MTHHPFRSALFFLALYAVTSLWTGTAQATCSPTSVTPGLGGASQPVITGVTYYDCSNANPAVHVVTINRNLSGYRMHILANPTSTWDTFNLRRVDTLAIENYALVAINGFAWRGDEGLCVPLVSCPSNPTGIPTSTLYLWGQQRTSFNGAEALMGFSGLQPKLLNKDSIVDQSAYPENLTYRQSLYGSTRSILNDVVLDENGTIQKGVCRLDSTELSETYSAIGYSQSQIILLTAWNPVRPDQLCDTFKAFGADYAVLNDGGSAGQMYVAGLNYFIDPMLAQRQVAYAIGLVPVGAQGNIMKPNDVLIPGQSIFAANGAYQLIYQYDGNLVLYRIADSHPLWASNTNGKGTRVAVMQTDGNLVVYNKDKALWASNTCCDNSGYRLRLLDDGNMIIDRPSDGHIAWQSYTAQPGIPPPSESHPVESRPPSIAVKRNDYNRDGISDIVAVRDDCLHRWYGNGSGGFNYAGTYGCGWTPYAATLTAVGDINRDGNGDLVAVSNDCLHRWYGNGSGGFNYAGTYGCGWTPYAATLTSPGDINGDGVGDLVAVRDDCLHRWYGNGSGGFDYAGTYGCGWTPYQDSLTGAGDINSDGIGDLVAVRDDCLHRWYGNGSGGFTYAGTYGCGWTPYAATLTGMGDINGDGVGDLLSTANDCLHRWYGNGSGGFTYAGTYGCGWTPYPIR